MKKKRFCCLLVSFVLYSSLCIFLCSICQVDSDKANHLLQAEDILKGNFFLKGWNLTGVNFLFTDLPFYGLGFLLGGGVSPLAVSIATGLMISSVIFLGALAAVKDNDSIDFRKLILFLFSGMIPCFLYINFARVHAGAVLCSVLAFLIYSGITSWEGKKRIIGYVGLFLIFSLGIMSDLLVAILGVLPIAILSALYFLFGKDTRKTRLSIIAFLVTVSSVFAGLIFEKLYYLIGKANKNSYIGSKLFTESDSWDDKLESFWNALSGITFADFDGRQMADIWNILKLPFVALIVVTVCYGFYILFCTVSARFQKIDDITALFTFSALFSFCAFLFTDMSEPRYIIMIPLFIFVVFVRNYEKLFSNANNLNYVWIFLCIVFLMGSIGKVKELRDYKRILNSDNEIELASCLSENNLVSGYASFWSSSVITVLSDNEIKIRHIEGGDNYHIMNWFNKNSWYDNESHFVVIKKDDDSFGVNADGILGFFGIPDRTIDLSAYTIFVYSYDLSTVLVK